MAEKLLPAGGGVKRGSRAAAAPRGLRQMGRRYVLAFTIKEVDSDMLHITLGQVGTAAEWVGPTMAISLAVLALSFLGMAVAIGLAALRVAAQVRKIGMAVDGLQDDAAEALKAMRRLAEQSQDLMVLVRHEAGAFAHAGRRLRRKAMRGADRIEAKLHNLETLYDVVHDEVEDTALDVAAALRSLRSGNGMLSRVRRVLVPSRR